MTEDEAIDEAFGKGAAMNWQPIETAPRDGRAFLVFLAEPMLGSRVQAWTRRSVYTSGTIGGLMAFDAPEPTHWMPLPAPPKIDDET